jgi:signal transduction histidine kinase
MGKMGLNFLFMPDFPKQQPEKPITNNDRSEQASTRLSECGILDAAIVQSLPIGVVAFDTDLKIIKANPEAEKLIKLGDYIDESLAKGTDEKIWQGWTGQLRSMISTGEIALFDDVDYTCNKETRLLRIVCSALKETPTARSLGGTMIIEDVTERVKIQRRLTNAGRLAIVGRHASQVAHELNNPLDGILRYINLAIRIVEQENLEKPIEYLAQCRRGLMRMVQIVGELLEFSRSTYTPMENAKVEQLIEEAVKTMESRAESSGVSVSRDYAPGLPQIRNGNLFQVFCNLTKNALDAMANGGQLKISARPGQENTIVIEFRDTGTGLPPDKIEAIFEPFFTTKGDRKGTGLGLAICRDIIESHNGRITAENAPGGGSIFTVYLPVGT